MASLVYDKMNALTERKPFKVDVFIGHARFIGRRIHSQRTGAYGAVIFQSHKENSIYVLVTLSMDRWI